MKMAIVYESMYGNTHAIADATADGARSSGAEVTVQPVSAAPSEFDADVLVVGGPTHMHGLTSELSRKMAASAGKEDGHELEPDATADPSLRSWLRSLTHADHKVAAAFDTRGDARAAITGSAARGIARRLHRHGYDVSDRESFLVDDAEGPLADGELDRARTWGATLAG